ncbi:MAG: GNAT family N-acetyltransferase [Devosia sp.]
MNPLRDALPATITTDRLVLRAPTSADLADLVALANNWKVIEPTAVMPFPYRTADGELFLSTLDDPAKPRAYAITGADDRLMGVVSLKFETGKTPEIGYWLGEPFWGQGYAPEAVQALLDGARGASIDRINARVLADNPASVRVLEKCGFTITEHTVSVVERHRGKPLLILGWSASA